MKERDWTRVLGWPGYQVYEKEIDEAGKKLKLWVRRKKRGLKLICSGCGQHVPASRIQEISEREVRDLPCFEYSTTIVVETYRMKCPHCGFRAEKVAQLPSKAPFSKRFEEAVGQACESASARQVARRFGMDEADARLALERHATSKIAVLDDLARHKIVVTHRHRIVQPYQGLALHDPAHGLGHRRGGRGPLRQ